ncbi:flagellar export chaperone FlgN [Halomonas sp.]|uniref:flagellar export chaperone FlgN n=1 Tax=Halomonas sp. TaxID=1486246 RepID=UPI00384FE704
MSLTRLLSDQHGRLVKLTQLLERELQLLTASDVDGESLAHLAQSKRVLLNELESKEIMRRQVQSRLNYPEGLEGARAAAEEAGCMEEWEACLSATERTARLNDLAGELLQMRASHNKKMLDFIHQIADKTLYDPSGRTGRQPGRLNTSA